MRAAPLNPDKRVCRTCAMLHQAYLNQLEHLPEAKITVAGVCRAADINRSTFYQHYDDLAALRDDLFVCFLEQVDVQCRMIKEQTLSSDQVMHLILMMIREHQVLLRVFVVEHRDVVFWNQLDRRIQDLFWVKLKQESTYYSGLSMDEQQNILLFLTYGFYAIFRRWLESHCQEEIETLTATAAALTNRCIKAE